MIDWLIKQVSTQWIAIITAIAGFIVWRQDHSKLIVESDTTTEQISKILLDNGTSITNDEHSMQHLFVWLVNPSVNDISFFDLRVTLNGHEIDYFTELQFNHQNNLQHLKPESITPLSADGTSNGPISVLLPRANYGTVQSHGFVQLDLIFQVDEPCEHGLVLMKLAQPHSLLGWIRHSHKTPKWLHPKFGYIFSETKEVALSFQVNSVQILKNPD